MNPNLQLCSRNFKLLSTLPFEDALSPAAGVAAAEVTGATAAAAAAASVAHVDVGVATVLQSRKQTIYLHEGQ